MTSIPEDVELIARTLNMKLHRATELGQRTQWIAEAIIADREARSGGIPAGYKLVPVEPTHHMVRSGSREVSCLSHKGAEACYAAMLDAAPSRKETENALTPRFEALAKAYKRGVDFACEGAGVSDEDYVNLWKYVEKAAYDYADKETSAHASPSPSREETEGEKGKAAVTYSQEEYDEAYEIGKRDGYSDAVQDIDEKTGGDGEYRYCLGMEDDIRHQPDPATMIQRIVDRFETLNLLEDASKSGRDQEWGDKPDTSALLLEAEKALERDIRSQAINIICQEAEELGYSQEDVADFREGHFDGDDLLILQAVERALSKIRGEG